MAARIAINGFGRIGRAALKIISERDDAEIVAINDLSDIETLAYLLKYDTATQVGILVRVTELEEPDRPVKIHVIILLR